VEGVGIPRHAGTARRPVQRAAAAAKATAAGVSPVEHDGTIYDAKPDGTTVHGAIDDDVRARTNAYDAAAASAAAANDGTTTSDDSTNGTIISNGTAAAIGQAAIEPVTAVCWIRNGITNGEELMTVRGGRIGSFKQ
jgi:hypothetical protein